MPLPVQAAVAALNASASAVEPMELGDEGGDLVGRDQPLPDDHVVYNPTLVSVLTVHFGCTTSFWF